MEHTQLVVEMAVGAIVCAVLFVGAFMELGKPSDPPEFEDCI